ncbi:hypothetical protein Acr_00g0054990 [Actinidia rufa]|uniref:Protein FAR1-RELATED SEQUENCE n=1 Tax=Actinidia rufa TaxID=165716 RepID=A0A7J0DLR9_9ERIC|nr:hypothetical protein Acr_00g0054990 [Actinidia rufa]
MEIEDMDLEENMNMEAVLEPKVGTIFNSENEAKEYYSTYAKAKGFGSVVKASKKRGDGGMCDWEGGLDNVTWIEKDARNHKDKVRRSELKEGDAEAMHKYFVRMQEDNGNFFYAIDNNGWLAGLYEERHRWVPAFFKDTFWAGMSTTQRSKSMNAFFDGYVHSNTSLKEFVEQYDNALRKKVQQEEEADARSLNVQIQNVSPYEYENQFQQAYTVKKCKQFREQVAATIGCSLTVGLVVNGISQFHIEQDILVGKKHKLFKTFTFLVHFNEESTETNCNCRLFESSKGMVCAHMIKVWSKKKLQVVLDKYILRRWRKNLVRSYTKIKVSYVKWERKPEFVRYDILAKLFNEGADKVIYSVAKTNRMAARLREIIVENELDVEDYPSNMPTVGDAQFDLESFLDNSNIVGDPSKGPRRGRPVEKRKQPMIRTHATGFGEIITQENGTVTESVGYNGTWCYDLNESPFDLGHDFCRPVMEILSPASFLSGSNWLFEEIRSTRWTPAENKMFEDALAVYDEVTPDQYNFFPKKNVVRKDSM